MKKLLAIFASISMIIVPTSQLVSCARVKENKYKNLEDIAKYWNYKNNNNEIALPSIINESENLIDKFYQELKTTIAFNFNNISEDLIEFNDIKFKFYLLKNENHILNEEELKNLLDTFNNVHKEIWTEIYFKYEVENYKSSEFLDLKLTNKFKFEIDLYNKSNLFKSLVEEPIIVPINKLYVSKLEKDIKKNTFKTKDIKLLANGIISSIEKVLGTKFANNINWFKNENLHADDDKSYEWKKLSAGQELYYMAENLNIIQIAKDLLKNKIAIPKELNNFLGLNEPKLIFKLDRDI